MKVRVAILLTCLLFLAATPASVSAATESGSGPPPCTAAALVPWLPHGFGDGTAGSVYYKLELINLSERSCTVSGFPGVSAYGLDGMAIGAPASQETFGKVQRIRLDPGDSAVAQLRIVDAEAITRSACRPMTAAGLRVRLPGQKGSRPVPLPFEACARGASVLSIRAFRPAP